MQNKSINFLKSIFSITNSYDKKHKVVTLLGIKLKIKKKPKPKDKLAYYEYIESYKNQSKNDFISITEIAYNNTNSVKPIAFYLPQFHSIPLNDENFGKGFTEWTNVTKAIPQFDGHHQPQLPIDVGFYDLSTDKVMYRQVELAKLYGIYGFCFHYYWFSGKRLLEKPLFNWLNNKELDLPFCLCWANENWSKLWDGGNREVMMEQKLRDGDDEKFFYDILPFFKDDRYIKIDNKPILIIYRLNLFDETRIKTFVKNIKRLALKEGFDGIYLIGAKAFNCFNPQQYGADATVEFPPLHMKVEEISKKYINKNFVGKIFELNSYVKEKKYMNDNDPTLYKTLFPGWDNTARKAKSNAAVFLCNPELYKEWLSDLIKWTKANHKKEEQFVFVNAWNEWGEGAHLEPDQRYGYAYLQATKDALEEKTN